MKIFSEQLRKLRNKKDLSQKKLAENLFVSQQTVAKWETDQATPNPETLIKIADFFNVTVDYLVGKRTTVEDNHLNDFQFALYGEVKELSEGQKKDVLNFIKFIKSQEEKKKGN